MRRALVRTGCLLVVGVWCVLPAQAQTREAEVERQQAAKAAALTTYEPNRLERILDGLERWFSREHRIYPAFGAVELGGGFTAGATYRHFIGYDSFVALTGRYSTRGYKGLELSGHTPDQLGNRVDLSGSVGWVDATAVPFFGLGIDSRTSDETNFRFFRTYLLGAVDVRLVDWLGVRLNGGLDDYDQRAGLGPTPSTEQRFTSATAPLLGDDRLYLRGELSATVYWLDTPGYSRKGGLYRFGYEEFNPLRGAGDTFGLARAELVQHVPIYRETWVISLRGRTESIVRESDEVPYFLLPTLGGGDSLRGYATGRFRDRHAALATMEFRWFPNRLGLDMALFYEAGTVASGFRRLDANALRSDWGIGVRFHTLTATALRFDLARGDEGWRIVFATSAPF